MKDSSKKPLTPEDRILAIKKMQAHLLSDCYPPGMDRKKAAAELMKLRNTRLPKKKGE